MIKFKTKDAAIEYAENNIGKYDYEIVLVDGKYTMLSSTCLPIEETIRGGIESVIDKLLREHIRWDGKIDRSDENYLDDAVCYIGNKATETIIEELEKYGINIISAYLDF